MDHTPFGHLRPKAFIATRRHDWWVALPGSIGGAMNAEVFDRHAETRSLSTRRESEMAVFENRS